MHNPSPFHYVFISNKFFPVLWGELLGTPPPYTPACVHTHSSTSALKNAIKEFLGFCPSGFRRWWPLPMSSSSLPLFLFRGRRALCAGHLWCTISRLVSSVRQEVAAIKFNYFNLYSHSKTPNCNCNNINWQVSGDVETQHRDAVSSYESLLS